MLITDLACIVMLCVSNNDVFRSTCVLVPVDKNRADSSVQYQHVPFRDGVDTDGNCRF